MTRAFALALLSIACGCGDSIPATFVMVTVDAEAGVRAEADRLEIVVRGSSADTDEPTYAERFSRTYTLAADDLVWPRSVALEPAERDTSRLFEFVATAFNSADDQIGQVRVLSGYVPNEKRAIRLVLEDSCTERTCLETQTCRANECVDANVDPSALQVFDPKPTTDAGHDSGVDATVGVDGAADAADQHDAQVADAQTPDAGREPPLPVQCQQCLVDAECPGGRCTSNGVSAGSCFLRCSTYDFCNQGLPVGSQNRLSCSTYTDGINECRPTAVVNFSCAEWIASW